MALKEPVEIICPECDTHFRLWIPIGLLDEWGARGEEMGCIKCDARFVVRKKDDSVRVIHIQKEKGGAETPGPPQAELEEETEGADGAEKILFVDDDRLAAALAQSELADTGLNVVVARSAEEALDKLSGGGKFSLLVTDLHLKDADDPEAKLDGDGLLRKVVESGREIPAIVTTGKEIVDDLVLDPKWVDLEVKGFVQKGNPFWTEELKAKIKEILKLN